MVSELFAGKEKSSRDLKSLPEAHLEDVLAVNIEAAMQVFDGDDELLREAVDLFLKEDYPQQLKLLREGIERQDASAVRTAAHSIKGAVRSLGGTALGDIALRLEKLGHEGKLEGARELADKLEGEVKQFADYYSRSVEI